MGDGQGPQGTQPGGGVSGQVLRHLLDWGALCWRRREMHRPPSPKGDTPRTGKAGSAPLQPSCGVGTRRSQPLGWGARVGRGPRAPSPCAFPPGWPGCSEAINWFHSSANEMEMRLPDRGALSGGRRRPLSAPGGRPQPCCPSSAAGAPRPGAPRAPSLAVTTPVLDAHLSASALCGDTH